MNKGESNPAVQKAISYIKANLESGIWQAGALLPSTRNLALMIGVSRSGILTAIEMLKSAGLIHTMHRGGIRAGSEFPVSHILQTPKPAVWQMKRSAIEKDILSGAFAHQGSLLSIKELQARYGTCFATMRKILRSMVDDGVLRLQGKKYEPVTMQLHQFRQRVVFITYQSSLARISALNQGQYRVMDQLEQECIRRELKLDIVEIDFDSSVEARKVINSPVINEPVFGYVLDLWWFPSDEYRRSMMDLLSHLAASKQPLAILDENGNFDLPAPFSGMPMIQVFRIEGKKAGARMARFLLGMGHQSVAYLSSVHDYFWSRQRLEGVLEQFAKADCRQGVKIVTGENMEITHEHSLAISGFDDRLIRKILGLGRSSDQAREMYHHFVGFMKTFSSKQWRQQDLREIRNNLGIVSDMDKRKPSLKLFERVNHEVFADIGILMYSQIRSPLFKQALSYPDVTAWICVTDGIAISALSFLRDRGIAIPQDLSITGFDNLPEEAVKHRLTTFDFNPFGFVHRILNHIARPPRPRGPYRHAAIEVEGIVMQRDTTAPPMVHRVAAPGTGFKAGRPDAIV